MVKIIFIRMIQVKVLKNQAFIEEVNDRDLEKLVEENDFVAVAWFEIIKILRRQELFTCSIIVSSLHPPNFLIYIQPNGATVLQQPL